MTDGKMTKDELREDKVVAAFVDAGQTIKKNAIAIGTVVVLVVAALIVVFVVRQGRERAEQQAAVVLLEGEGLYASGSLQEALPRFSDAADRYGGSRSGKLAMLRVGDCHLEVGNSLEARNWYERFLGTNPEDGLLRASGLRGLAASRDALGESAEAARGFLEASRIEGNPLRADDLVSAGFAWIDAGNQAEAEAAFREVLSHYPSNPRVREAREGLQLALARKGL